MHVDGPGSLPVDSSTVQTSDSLVLSDFQPVNLDAVPVAGQYLYIRNDQPDAGCTWARGPRFRYARRGPSSGAQSSTMSHSSRSTARQSLFKMQLARRDGRYIVTDSPEEEDAVAAHILRVSRPEYYREILGTGPRFPVDLFHVSYGILLDPAWHRAFDTGDWGLFQSPDSTDLLVHVFQGEARKAFHGKRMARSRFRVWDRLDKLPTPQMLEFQYKQCLIKNIRGFQHFPA